MPEEPHASISRNLALPSHTNDVWRHSNTDGSVSRCQDPRPQLSQARRYATAYRLITAPKINIVCLEILF